MQGRKNDGAGIIKGVHVFHFWQAMYTKGEYISMLCAIIKTDNTKKTKIFKSRFSFRPQRRQFNQLDGYGY